jgi:hypothetical protein
MGLLDDAIREHLELKRLHGADPGHVAREEQEALGPVPRKGDAEPGGPPIEGPDEAAVAIERASGLSEPRLEADPGDASQETTELDMSTVLEGDLGAAREPAPEAGTSDAGSGDSLEWEMPHVEHGASAEDRGREQEAQEGEQGAEPPVEDVLEATPDFLRETPEQERLWFEQRPPRDFDFDK